jgi:hypothetical protein
MRQVLGLKSLQIAKVHIQLSGITYLNALIYLLAMNNYAIVGGKNANKNKLRVQVLMDVAMKDNGIVHFYNGLEIKQDLLKLVISTIYVIQLATRTEISVMMFSIKI